MSSENNNGLEFDLFITDLNGNLRGKRLPADAMSKVLKEGMKMPRSVVGLDVWGEDVPSNGLVFETGDSDGVCLPVSDEPMAVPWASEPRNQMLAAMHNADGTLFDGDARNLLRQVVERYKALGLTPVVATELEFYLIDSQAEDNLRPRPPKEISGRNSRLHETDGYSIDNLDRLDSFFSDVRHACEQQDIGADTIIAELGPGQFEINLNHRANPLRAADEAVLFKRLVKGVAHRHDMAATFMAKPYADQSGNGFHVHFSLLDADGNNVFDNGGDEGTATLRHAIGGLMHTMADSMLVFAPHMNSYRRFMAGSHAPLFASWGYENRTTALRVPDSPPIARRIEHRVSGADANPYLVIAAVLAGALHGIESLIDPGKPMEGDAYNNSSPSLTLPNRWEKATDLLEHSEQMKALLSETFVRVFCSAKRQEQQRLLSIIPDVEYEAYVGLL